ncbi:MAG: ATP-binding protein [Gloeocapsa sp. DLM2.Bin57]|nr:MAG: ATP-binding protein [Gloeocapsa sp. DLM2.Bin57]
MKIISLQLTNFRQFYGKTPLIYFSAGERNSTVIHGNNGAGKTTLLNAFTWVLYEKFTPAFASPQLLINKRAIAEKDFNTSVECSVTLEFEHDAKIYRLQRKCYAYQNDTNFIKYSKSQPHLTIAGDDGRWYLPPESPDDVIEGILPSSLHHYFFFDGEYIDHISRSDKKTTLAEDTKELIGIKVVERAIEHVKKAKKTFQDELKQIGDIQVKKILQQQHNLEHHREQILAKITQIKQDLVTHEQTKQQLNQELLKINGAVEMQKRKIELENQEKRLRSELQQIKQQIKNLLSNQGFTVFLEEIFTKFQGIVNELREKGELPSGIKKDFVEQLLNRQCCICGQQLIPGSEAYQTVETWTNQAGIAQVEETIIRLETQVNNTQKITPDFWLKIDNAKQKINQLREELAQKENQLDNIKETLRTYPEHDIKNLQIELDQLELLLKELTIELGANQQQLTTIESQITDLERQINKHQVKEEKQNLAKRRIQATEEIITRLNQVKELLEKEFRLALETKIQEIFSTISFTPYIPRINENYELNLIENTTKVAIPVAASTGENQILSLSFIGGIIDRVREWSQHNKLMGPDSSTFPMVMDSPFGSLDEIYRRQVAKSLPKLANQLVMMVTKTQWRIEVEQEIQPHLGKQYVLVYYSPKSDCQEDSIIINNRTYPLVQRSPNDFEYTEIIAVE